MRLLLLLAALLTIFVVPGLCQDAYPVSKEYLIKKLSKKKETNTKLCYFIELPIDCICTVAIY